MEMILFGLQKFGFIQRLASGKFAEIEFYEALFTTD
jgi:hypothetical protein